MTHVAETPHGAALLSSPVRRAIVDYIANRETAPDGAPVRAEGLTAAELSDILTLHVTTARFHLDQLVNGGILEATFVKAGVGRPRKVYSLAPGSFEQARDEHGMRMLTELLTETFSANLSGDPITPFEAGRRWAEQHIAQDQSEPANSPGTWLGKIGRLVDVLRDWGYTPNLSTSQSGRTAELELAHCPFLDLAKSNPAVVCGIHRGLLKGALERLGEDDADVSLEPFVGPSRCLAHVTTNSPFTRSTAPSQVHDIQETA